MLAIIGTYWGQFASAVMALVMFVGTTFGLFVPSTTSAAENYFDENVKNVIFLIGDGMGFNHLNKTKNERSIELTMDEFDIYGASRTRSTSSSVTDSAAGGTALATGIRTTNGTIGVYPMDPVGAFSYPKNITELCLERGMMTGVITTDATSGATPASFSAHSSDRGNTADITEDQLTSEIDLIWGTANDVATKADAEANGFTYITTTAEMMALPEGGRSFAQFTNNLWTLAPSDANTPTLSMMARKAIDILDDTDEGFFLMIEGAHIDKHSHSNDDAKMTESLEEFDRTIEYVLEYAKADGETLVVITADHETGAIVANDDGTYSFTSGSHSDANVPVLVYGTKNLIQNGETLNNYEIPIRIAYTLGFTEDEFPYEVAA